jgi:glucose/arabinose dehydrogenase
MRNSVPALVVAALTAAALSTVPLLAQSGGGGGGGGGALEGKAAFGDWRADRPGTRRLIRPQDLPGPAADESVSNFARIAKRTAAQKPTVPPGFVVDLFAAGLDEPRLMRVAPNGDVFIAETEAGRIRILRPDGQRSAPPVTFTSGLLGPFGIAFYPAGADPQWVYVADTDAVIRFPYRVGDRTARGPQETIVARLPVGGHSTRDVVFSPDGQTMYVSVGSASNDAERIGRLGDTALREWQSSHALGAAWGYETDRAGVLAFDPQGKQLGVFATGIRNCVGMAVDPATGTPWCSTNERDGLGDNLVPDYITRVRKGAFYGWPWYYMGANEDPRHRGERPDLKDSITVPDVLIEAHSASLQMTFYGAAQFPAAYRGSIFAAEHGSWNRSKRTGYKVIRVIVKDGVPNGEYEDFATGFVVDDATVWGRPVGVAVDKDGALLVSEDANGTVWRITYSGKAAER